MGDIVSELVEFTRRGDRTSAAAAIKAWLQTHGAENLLSAVLKPYLDRVGEEWQHGSLSLAQAYVATKIAEDAIYPEATGAGGAERGQCQLKGPVVIGNAEGDFHALGRMMVELMLKADHWDVIDLGNDVPAELFVDSSVKARAKVIGVSAMMYKTALHIAKIRRLLDERGLSGRIKLAVGGAAFRTDPGLAGMVGGDATCDNATDAPTLFQRLWEEATTSEGGPPNSRARVMAALKGEPVGRRPFVPILSLYGARLIDAPLEQYYREPALYAAGQAAVQKAFHADILLTPLFFSGEAEAFGARLKFFPDDAPNISKFPVSSVKEFTALEFPDIDTNPSLCYFRESLRLMRVQSGPDMPIGGILLNPIDLPSVVMGINPWLDALMFQPEERATACDRAIDHFVAWGNALLADGASFLVSSGGLLGSAVATRELVETIFVPVLRKAFAKIDGLIVIHDGGSTLLPFMDLYRGLPNVVALYASSGVDLAEARLKAGADCALIACVDGPTLDKLTPDEVYDRCVTLLEKGRHDPRLLLGTSGPDIPLETSPGNILAMYRAVESVR